MSKIGLFFGTDTGNTQNIAEKIIEMLGEELVEAHNLAETDTSKLLEYDLLLLGAPTWYDGELQTDWEDVVPQLEEMDFSGKKFAMFGLGDQWGYADWFVDALGIIGDVLVKQGGERCGLWPLDGYEFEASKGVRDDKFLGLPIDEDNQPELTDERLNAWMPQVLQEFGFELE
jgi:flavodoxin I